MGLTAISFDPDFASPSDWAAMYRSIGLQVVPGREPHGLNWKRPALKEWKEFQETPVPDPIFARWYAPGAEYARLSSMGIIAGRASGNVFVIDLDEYKDHQAISWWRAILAVHNNGIEPETCQQITGGGGRQMFFRAPVGWRAPTNKTPISVDIRGQGGFAVIPPSQHQSGKPYAWKAGCAPWEVPIADAPDWLLQEVTALVERYGGDQGRRDDSLSVNQQYPTIASNSGTDFNAFGLREDGREDYMTRLIWGAVVNWYRECPIRPSEAESQTRLRETWQVYERKTKTRLPGDNTSGLEREGRGPTLFAEKWRRTMAQWGSGVAEDAAEPKPDQKEETNNGAATTISDVADTFETLDLVAIDSLPPPTWLVEGLIPENGLTFIYGSPGKGKSFFTLDLALRISHGFDWYGKECRQGGVLYVAGEGKGGYRNRVHGWHHHHGLVADNAPFRLLPRAVNFMSADEVAKLIRTIKAVIGSARLVIIDTVARVLPGAEENASKEMGLFVAACDKIRDVCGVAVIGVHHSGKDEERGMRGSSALEGAGDCIIHLSREDGSNVVKVITEKQKDGEETKPVFLKMIKVEWPEGLKSASTLVPDTTEETSARDLWPDKDTCRRIISAINDAWISGKPWSFEPQSKRAGRYGPKLMGAAYKIKIQMAETMIETWLMNDVLSVEVRNSDTKMRGLKVIGNI